MIDWVILKGLIKSYRQEKITREEFIRLWGEAQNV